MRSAGRGGGVSAIENTIRTIEDHHRAVGAFLKYVEAAITDLRYNSYLNDRGRAGADREVGKGLDNIIKAIQQARPGLDRERTRRLGGRPGGDDYFGDELDRLHKLVYAIETKRKIHNEELQAHRELDRVTPLEDPDERKWRKQELALSRFTLPDEIQQELDDTIGNVMSAARGHPQLLPGNPPVALDVLSVDAPPTTDRQAALRTALLENPNQPQATFVKLCRVHPNTVRRCRRELDEAGAIPFLAHRHTT
jgi:hypothetical protein